jgi:hypothetical protein
LNEGASGQREVRLGRILDFFGVPWKAVDISHSEDIGRGAQEHAVFGSVRSVASALKQGEVIRENSQPAAFYAFVDDNRDQSLRAFQSICANSNLSLQDPPAGPLSISISAELADITGAMAGLIFSTQLRSDAAVLKGVPTREGSTFVSIVSAGGDPVFLRFFQRGIPVFLCTSSEMVDIDEPVGRGFYDVKNHFCSVVPLIMFIRSIFPDVAWRPQELGACLIIDDPLLRSQYGFCDFAKLRDLMRRDGFTTNIAFIPWNWRRTSASAGDFFKKESELFSISIHGCDHTASEFGVTSIETLNNRTRLARSRMRNHRARTGIRHDSIMVFPQGVFSSATPGVLQSNNFLAAVNTEIGPVDSENARTRIRDAWDVAITTYGSFPIFTRRYAFHGLENFAFDLLLGKPCLIVVHHDIFKDGGSALIELIQRIGSLNCFLHWRPLGEVVRRACRRRANDSDSDDVVMYGNELLIGNPSNQTMEVRICKTKSQNDSISEVLCDEKPIMWTAEAEQLFFKEWIQPHAERRFRVVYREQPLSAPERRTLQLEMSVAARRILSELRDNFLSRSSFLSAFAHKLKPALRKGA